jgi:hypothetical protein
LRLATHIDFLEIDALFHQQPLGRDAIGAGLGGVDLNRFQGVVLKAT